MGNSPDEYTKDYTDHCEMLYSLSLLRDKWDVMRQSMLGMRKEASDNAWDAMRERLDQKIMQITYCINDIAEFIEGYE